MSLFSWLGDVWKFIKNIFKNLPEEAKVLLPAVIEIVNKAKEIAENSTVDAIIHMTSTTVDDALRNKFVAILNTLSGTLTIYTGCTTETDAGKVLACILSKINVGTEDQKKIFYHGLAALILEKAGDGKFTWSDAIAVVEYYYAHHNDTE